MMILKVYQRAKLDYQFSFQLRKALTKTRGIMMMKVIQMNLKVWEIQRLSAMKPQLYASCVNNRSLKVKHFNTTRLAQKYK